ncbi:MAG: 7-cyano-7-deazaguanine synthase [Elusimicrobiota bacterium]|nr:7-cyano-7-deazaguanine synthase [Elusimicrobiota bacterium]
MKKAPVVALTSGGEDSGVLADELAASGRVVFPLFVRCGFLWEEAELRRLRRQLRAIRRPNLKPLTVMSAKALMIPERHWSRDGRGTPSDRDAWDSVYLPGRNLLLLTCAAALAHRVGAREIAIATLAGNPFPDATRAFFRDMERAIRDSFKLPARVIAPYRSLSKEQVRRRRPDFPFHLTFSCLRPKAGLACGRCSKCGERDGRRP